VSPRPIKTLSNKARIAVLNSAIDFTQFMHGSVVGDPAFPHTIDPSQCGCQYGETIRGLRIIRKEVYRERRLKP
jgi:hypothetical protein